MRKIKVTGPNLCAVGIRNTYDIVCWVRISGDVAVTHTSADKWVTPGWVVWSFRPGTGSVEHRQFVTYRDTKEARRVEAIAWANDLTGRRADTQWARDPFGGWHPADRLTALADWLNTDAAEGRRQGVAARLSKFEADRAAEDARQAARRGEVQKGTR
jgi:hypothetical protein